MIHSIRTEEAEDYIARNPFPLIEIQQYADKILDCSAFIDFMRTRSVPVFRELYKRNAEYMICLKSELRTKPNTRGIRNKMFDELQILWKSHEFLRKMRISQKQTRKIILSEIMLVDGVRKAEEQINKWKKDDKESQERYFQIARKGAHQQKGKILNKKQRKEFADAMIAIYRVGRRHLRCARCSALLGSVNNVYADPILLSKHRFQRRFSLINNVLHVLYYY
ncbi:hypothetical protein GCK72_022342 [Caenorhabditis remanei]|uniref:Uncharacterized protein n=1 Tax=Caenorhabditis remanei TaxID=31234 RepID=A0A6A5FTS7_CAERE|nr:hypothetical protein GCK72_022342 [Caenorhabditis remanei]KAF1745895.1 hypothetical protein GCK72_022342 [Caenorhabditis remanei]